MRHNVLVPTEETKAALLALFQQEDLQTCNGLSGFLFSQPVSKRAHFEAGQTYAYGPRHNRTYLSLSHSIVYQEATNSYLVLKNQIGKGAFGKVFKIEKAISLDNLETLPTTSPNRILKIQSLEQYSPKQKEKYQTIIERESLLSANLSYLAPKEQFRQGEFFYLEMNFLEGNELYQLLDKDHENLRQLSIKERLTIMKNLLNCYKQHFHSQNLLHCDLKPENILITDTLSCFILDLGNAFMKGDKPKHLAKGTVGFSSVELLEEDYINISEKTDVFSLGRIFILLMRVKTIEAFFDKHSSLADNKNRAWYKFSKSKKSLMLPIFRDLPETVLSSVLQKRLYDLINKMVLTDHTTRAELDEVIQTLDDIIASYQQALNKEQTNHSIKALLARGMPVLSAEEEHDLNDDTLGGAQCLVM
jgi:serine/threonine protein kinase